MTEITLYELKKYIEIAFDNDKELSKYHISNKDFASHTYEEICKTAEILSLKYYKIGEYGFTVLAPKLLYSFGINKKFRDKETLKNWFIEIKNIMPIFDCALHGKNSRAINHLIQQGLKSKEQIIVLQCH
jgi:hypothetical protein